jgi:peroxiredoxin
MKNALVVALGLVFSGVAIAETPGAAPAAQAPAGKNLLPDDAASAWKSVQASMEAPLPPAEWNKKPPTDEEKVAFRTKMGVAAGLAADKAKEFFARFPKDEHAAEAKEAQVEMLRAAINLGQSDRKEEYAKLRPESDSSSGPGSASDDPFDKRMQGAVAAATKFQSEGMEKMLLEFEKQVRLVMKDFPDRPQVYDALMEVADNVEGETGIKIADEVIASKATERTKEAASLLKKKLGRLGKPVDIKFKAVDGREVDLAALKGKVVLIDFWATWCGPCVQELPNVKDAYTKLHDKGFEIVGISFDEDKEALESFTKKKQMPWPQYFDGEGWGNKYGKEFGIRGIPAMWLIDKKGNLQDLNARPRLAAKVEKLLAAE